MSNDTKELFEESFDSGSYTSWLWNNVTLSLDITVTEFCVVKSKNNHIIGLRFIAKVLTVSNAIYLNKY